MFSLGLCCFAESDTIYFEKFPDRLLEELSFFKLNIVLAQQLKISGDYLGLNQISFNKCFSNRITSVVFISDDTVKPFEFFPSKHKDFIIFVKRTKHLWVDSVVVSEEKGRQGIELSKTYRAFQYLNPIRVNLKVPNVESSEFVEYRNLVKKVIVFIKKNEIELIKNIQKIIVNYNQSEK